MITNGKPTIKDTHVVENFSELARDGIELAELQGHLLALDTSAAWQRMRGGLVLVIIGGCVLLGCMPVVLMIGAEALVEFAGWSRTAALGLAGGSGLVVAGGILAVAYYRLQTVLDSFNRSREELVSNLNWLKSKLRRRQSATRSERAKDVTLAS